MLFLRCVSCGKVLREVIYRLIQSAVDDHERMAIFTTKGIRRHCCRRHYLSDVDTHELELEYSDVRFG